MCANNIASAAYTTNRAAGREKKVCDRSLIKQKNLESTVAQKTDTLIP